MPWDYEQKLLEGFCTLYPASLDRDILLLQVVTL